METITQVANEMQQILGPTSNQVAEACGFSQRASKVTGSVFLQTLVFSTLEDPDWRYSELVAAAENAGVRVTKQGLAQRFSEESVALARGVLERAVQRAIQTEPTALPLLERFKGVYIRDSTIIALPTELEEVWAGSGSSHGSSAGIKLHTRLEVCGGQLGGPILAPAREHDQASPFQDEALPVGALRMGDLGFFSLEQFAADDQAGVFFLSRYKTGTVLYDPDRQRIPLLAWLRKQTGDHFERAVRVGHKQKLACRLLVERVPPAVAAQRRRKLREYARKKKTPLTAELLELAGWTLILTNIPVELLTVPEALIVLRVRWQIELLFKRWKSLFKIDEWHSADPNRILTELYAKLLAVVVEQWILLTGIYACPHPSFWKAALVVRKFATALAWAVADADHAWLTRLLFRISCHFRQHCHLDHRRSHPSLYQLLENAACITLA